MIELHAVSKIFNQGLPNECRALREVSVILVVLFGMRYLKEPFGGPRLLACGLVLIGMLVMKL